jgi:hypothetical protein
MSAAIPPRQTDAQVSSSRAMQLDQPLVIERASLIAACAKPPSLLPVDSQGPEKLEESKVMTGKLRKVGIAAVAALTFGGTIAMASTEALAFKGGGGHGFGGGGFGGHGFGGGGFGARGFGGGGFAARGFGGGSPMFSGRSVAARPGFATRGFAGARFAGVRPGFGGRNFAFNRGFRHRGFGFGLAAAGLVGAAAYGYGYPYYYGCDPYDDYYGYGGYSCGYPYPDYW